MLNTDLWTVETHYPDGGNKPADVAIHGPNKGPYIVIPHQTDIGDNLDREAYANDVAFRLNYYERMKKAGNIG